LSNSNGDSCQSYEYSVYGQVAASDPNHPNPYMFTGRRFDIETGLYYYRARYYNPHIGRFMQTDPVGYADGINWYLYCENNPINQIDPSGLWSHLIFTWYPNRACHLRVDLMNSEGPEDTLFFIDWIDWYNYQSEQGISNYYNLEVAEEDITWEITTAPSAPGTSGLSSGGLVAKAGMAVAVCAADGPSPVADAIVLGTATYTVVKYYARYLPSKSRKEYDKHVRIVEELRQQLENLQDSLKNTKGPKRKKPLEELIKEVEKQIKGHIKEIKQKCPSLPI